MRQFLFAAIFFLPSLSFAGKPLVAEAPFELCAAPFSISVSSFSWTLVPTSQCAGRTGVFLNQLVSSTGTARCIPATSSTTPSVSTSTYSVWDLAPTANGVFIGASDKVYLFCVSGHTAAESISGVESKQ